MAEGLEHQRFMAHALSLAHQAEAQGEVPIGAVIVYDNKIIGEGFNQVISLSDPTAHAEIMALRQAAKNSNNYRLVGASLYTTLEPCCMCAGALVHARIQTLHYAAFEPKAGACGSQFQLVDNPILNHKVEIKTGLLQNESSTLIKQFFKKRRA